MDKTEWVLRKIFRKSWANLDAYLLECARTQLKHEVDIVMFETFTEMLENNDVDGLTAALWCTPLEA